jgi:hypothetical protein
MCPGRSRSRRSIGCADRRRLRPRQVPRPGNVVDHGRSRVVGCSVGGGITSSLEGRRKRCNHLCPRRQDGRPSSSPAGRDRPARDPTVPPPADDWVGDDDVQLVDGHAVGGRRGARRRPSRSPHCGPPCTPDSRHARPGSRHAQPGWRRSSRIRATSTGIRAASRRVRARCSRIRARCSRVRGRSRRVRATSRRLRRSGRRVGSRRCGGRHLDVEHEARVLKQLGRGSQLGFGHAAGIARIDRDEGRNHESELILQERLGAEDRCRR